MKKKGLEILPPSLQAEAEAIKAQEDEKYRVDALMRLTKKLYMGLEPTAKKLWAVMDDVSSALYFWMFGGVEKEDSPIGGKRRDPYQEDIQWLIPFTEFVRKFEGKEYPVKGKAFEIIDRAISNLYDELYELGQNHKYLCDSVWCRFYQKGVWWKKVSDIGLRCLHLDIIIMALEGVTDLAEEWADEGSYLSQEWRKLEDELRGIAGLPSKQKPAAAADSEQKPLAAAEQPVTTPCQQTRNQVIDAVYKSYVKYRDKYESQHEAIAHAMEDNIDGITYYQLWRGKNGKGEPGTSVEGCKRTLRDNGYDLSYAPSK